MIYVSPFPLSDEVEGYYSKLLEVGGVEDPGMRYRVVYPENFNRLSPHLSLSAMLLYSPAVGLGTCCPPPHRYKCRTLIS